MHAFLVSALLVPALLTTTEPLHKEDVPAPLKSWVPWALDGDEKDPAHPCTFLNGEGSWTCAWPAKIMLSLDEQGGRFTQQWHVERTEYVPLPGDPKRWPLEVKLDGKPAVVVLLQNLPHVAMKPGNHTVTGVFRWDSVPETLRVPPETGLVDLTVRGAHLTFPNRDDAGLLYLSKQASQEEEENLDLTVQRKIDDGVPLLLTTRISLNVSGKAREVVLGRSLPDGFQPLSLDSPLPTRLEAQGRLRVQIRPGQWTLTLVARHDGPVASLTRPAPDGIWAEGEEIWVFAPHPELRLVTVSGVASVDPQQTRLPDEWKTLPAYPLKAGETLQLAEERRGDSDPSPDQLHLTRELWLDFDGQGYTVKDHLDGTMTRSARLTMAPGTELGRVEVGGHDQFITRLPGQAGVGVEVRAPQLNANADSRVPGSRSDIPAVGWQHDIQELRATLHLPPGWELLHVSGVDEVQTTWFHRWTLLDLFVLLITTLAVGRLFGLRWGAVAFVTLGMSLKEPSAPQWLWLALLGGEALVRALPKSGVQTAFRVYRVVVSAILVVFALSFLVGNVRGHLYPALAEDSEVDGALQTMDYEGSKEARATPSPEPVAAATAPAEAADATTEKDEFKAEFGKGAGKPLPKQRQQTIQVLRGVPGGNGAPTGGLASSYGSVNKQKAYEQAVVDLDRSVSVQTGPGLPQWSWGSVSLTWSGPVEQGQRLHLYYLSPGMNRFLAVLRLLLIALLVWRLVPFDGGDVRRLLGATRATSAAALLLALLCALAPSAARAQAEAAGGSSAGLPSDELLKSLQERLTRQPDCFPDCATSGKLLLETTATTLTLRLEISANAGTAVPLPGQQGQWLPDNVLVDGKPAAGLTRGGGDATLRLPLSPGVHQIVMQGPLPHTESVQLALPLHPHFVQAKLAGWTLAGLHEDGLADEVLQLTRVRGASPEGESSLQASQLPPFVHVRRTVSLALDWTVDTEVIRASPAGSAIVLEVPLLPGESVTSADVRVVDGKALVNLGAQAGTVAWHSTLARTPTLQLKAPASAAWVEEWSLDVSPLWHLTREGIPPIHPASATGAQSPEFRPWPGETLSLRVERPEGVPGQTLTLDQSEREVRPGLRSTDETLTFSVRSSRGGQHFVTLPEGAQLQSVAVGGVVQPIRQDGRKVTLPIKPGGQSVQLKWLEPRGMTVLYGTSPLDVGVPAVNTRTALVVPSTRWVLYAGGPRLGPVVLFWSLFLVMLLVSAALSRTGLTPLRLHEWLLLTVGITQVPVAVGAVVAGWLLLLGWRGRSATLEPHRLFNLRQVLLVAVTAAALIILGVAVAQGLLGEPDMQVSGNGSSGSLLRWFEDRTGSGLSSTWVLSAPQWLYRVAMLAWALWLARALLHWLRWGWGSFSSGGLWKSSPKVARAPAPAPPAPPPTA